MSDTYENAVEDMCEEQRYKSNFMILGRNGVGMSYSLKTDMLRAMYEREADVVVTDPKHELMNETSETTD